MTNVVISTFVIFLWNIIFFLGKRKNHLKKEENEKATPKDPSNNFAALFTCNKSNLWYVHILILILFLGLITPELIHIYTNCDNIDIKNATKLKILD